MKPLQVKKIGLCLFSLLLAGLFVFPVSAATDQFSEHPYDSYVYGNDDKPVAIPSPYITDTVVTSAKGSADVFLSPTDLFYDGDNRIYLCDTGHNRVVIFDAAFNYVGELTAFGTQADATPFNQPKGVYSNGTHLYIADSANGRIAVFDAVTYAPLYLLEKPVISVLEENYTYSPVALTVDNTGRIYVIATGINQGVICLNPDGSFANFLGAPSVEPDLLEMLWRNIATEEMLEQMDSYIPTEYSSVSIDSRGFVYTTSTTSTTMPVAKLNSKGDNVLYALKGDADYGDRQYTNQDPTFSDVVVFDSGSYMTLDSQSGKIFAYSNDGYLIYAFGAVGSQKGTFRTPAALELIGNRLAVVDSSKNSITLLRQTAFGHNVSQALSLYDEGKYDESMTVWKEIELLASGYPLATIQLAKVDIQNGNYRSAMKRLDGTDQVELYQKAFAKARDSFVRENFLLLTIIVLVVGAAVVIGYRLLRRLPVVQNVLTSDFYTKYKYGTYTMLHPIDGFWDIKRENRGSLAAALTTLGIFFVIYALRVQLSDGNVLYQCFLLLLPLLFYVIANWCFTTLMDGKGTLRDILTATGYAFKPYVICGIPLLLITELFGSSSNTLLTFLHGAVVVWVLALLFLGMMVTHDYSPSKTVIATVFTLIGICLIVFILLLITNIVQEVFQFAYNIYKELSFRTY